MQFIISPDDHDVRLDRFIRKQYKEIPLTGIFRFIRKGVVRVNGKKKKANYRLQANDVVWVKIAERPAKEKEFIVLSAVQKKEMAASVVFENENIVLCNKSPGLAMHEGSGHEYGFVEMMQSFSRNPRFTFVNRIDKATAGLVIGAKNRKAARDLSALQQQSAIDKYYYLMVHGLVQDATFTVSSFLKKEETRVEEYSVSGDGAKAAVSEFSVIKRDEKKKTTLLEARLVTGRTHQLRVQLANRHHPIIGDMKYGTRRAEKMLLFSGRVRIKAYNLDVRLPLPEYFYD